jgi:hypothetical protein
VVTGAATLFRAELRSLVLPIPTEIKHRGLRVIHDGWIALMISAVADLVFVPDALFSYRLHAEQQIGVRAALEKTPCDGPLTGVAAVREAARRRNDFSEEVCYLSAVYERLAAHAHAVRRKEILEMLHAMLAHLRTRTALKGSRLGRVPPVLNELFSRRYHRFSNGFASAAKDLWL